MKILIIEDNNEISKVLGDVLTDVGHEVDFAHTGKEGMDHLINHSPPDLIILDLFLPVINGAEFRSRQLQIPHLAHIPVIAMSADSCIKQRCHHLKIKSFLKKPFELKELMTLIQASIQH